MESFNNTKRGNKRKFLESPRLKKLVAEFEASGGKFKDFNIEDKKLLKCLSGRRKLTKLDLVKDGNVPVYSSESLNNGLAGYTSEKPDYILNDDNPLYVIFGEHTKTMNIVQSNFCVMDNVKVLASSITNIKELLYVLTSWKKAIPNLGYARHWSVAKKSKFHLPLNNNNEIDFNFMENYIRELEQERIRELERYLQASGLDNYKLTEEEQKAIDLINNKKIKFVQYKIKELFNLSSSKKKFNANSIKFGGLYPYVVRTSMNNGIRDYLTQDEKYLNPAKTFSFGQDTATIFYQEKPYFTGDKIKILDFIPKELNLELACFLLTAMNKAFASFQWGQSSFNEEVLNNTKINLPIENNEINYNFMNTYIKAIEKLVIKNVVDWKDKIIKTTKDVCNK